MARETFALLTNHAQVLLCLRRDPEARMRDVAGLLGITERAVQRIVAGLCDSGYLHREKQGRRNRYQVRSGPMLGEVASLAELRPVRVAGDGSPRVAGGRPIARNDSFID